MSDKENWPFVMNDGYVGPNKINENDWYLFFEDGSSSGPFPDRDAALDKLLNLYEFSCGKAYKMDTITEEGAAIATGRQYVDFVRGLDNALEDYGRWSE